MIGSLDDEHASMTTYMSGTTITIAGISLFLALLCLYMIPRGTYSGNDLSQGTIQILVLGDIGRSPRMQNHAISALKHGIPVDLIGYIGKSKVL